MNATHICQVGSIATGGRWQPNFPHIRLICKHLMEVEFGLKRRKVFQMPPRHGKTRACANVLPFHYFTMYPQREVIYVAHSADFAAEQGELLRNMLNDYGGLFGIGVSDSSSAKADFDIVDEDGRPTGGSFRAFGIRAGIHGRGCSLLILDDLFKNVEDATSPTIRDSVWRTYTSSLKTRLTPNGTEVSIGTPLHSDDWFGRAKKVEEAGGEPWEWVKLHALAREDDLLEREEGEPLWPLGGWTADKLEAVKHELTLSGNFRDWMAQYELEPITGDGVSEWPDDYFTQVFRPHKYKVPFWTSVLAIDTSKGARAQKKGDWQALVYAAADGDGHVNVKGHLHRFDVKGLRDKAIELYNLYRPLVVVVETNSAGYALLEDLWERGIPAIGRFHASHENKVVRLTQRLGRAFEAGILHFDDTPHNKLIVDQARLFPHGKYDDGIDAVEMALEFICEIRKPKDQRNIRYETRRAA